MNEIKELLEQWKEDGFPNPDSLGKAYEAISLLVDKVEQLEAQVQTLSNPQALGVFDQVQAHKVA